MRILVTGGAGFIGSNLVEALLALENVKHVRVLDNLATGFRQNIEAFIANPKFEFIEGDIRDYETCLRSCEGIDLITHQAALGSVPRSIDDPLTSHAVNVNGTLNIFLAAKERNCKRVVYASSSSVYGDHPDLPKVEEKTGKPLSPYAATKSINEMYAGVFAKVYGMELIGLRYFNIFGPKQNPEGPYAAVVPLFIRGFLENRSPYINGDGNHSRDFTYVSNAVQANLLSLFTTNPAAVNQVYNIACGSRFSLMELFTYLKKIANSSLAPEFRPERAGDVKHSHADISKAQKLLQYQVMTSMEEGLGNTYQWYKMQMELA